MSESCFFVPQRAMGEDLRRAEWVELVDVSVCVCVCVCVCVHVCDVSRDRGCFTAPRRVRPPAAGRDER